MRRHICITGCTKGLGLALTQWFLDRDWTVSGCGRTGSAVEKLQDESPADRSLFRVVDISIDEAVAAFADEVKRELSCPDILVCNAALINANAPLWEVPVEEFSKVVDVNIKGVANTLRHFAPQMIAQGSGLMINLSSGWGRSTAAEVAPYCATKWAIEGLSQAMAQELPSGVAVAAMNPGIINTEMLQSCFGNSASDFETADSWAERAGPYIESIDTGINGLQITVS